jgi:hypothetical protein
MPITRIVSGGQTGADRGGLDAAIYAGVPHGGWCPKGRKAEDGGIPAKYMLKEMKSADYVKRTEANVIDSDATLLITFGRLSGGSLRTLEFCRKHGRPYHHVNLAVTPVDRAVLDVCNWLNGDPDLNEYEDYDAEPPAQCVLNVAGSRESKADGIQHETARLVVDVRRNLNRDCLNLYPLPTMPHFTGRI